MRIRMQSLFMFLTCSATVFAGSMEQKHHVREATIYIVDDGIFLDVNGNPVPISLVGKDECGTYTPSTSILPKRAELKAPAIKTLPEPCVLIQYTAFG